MVTKALVRRRNKRGRPRNDEQTVEKPTTVPVFVCRDPQGVKLFKKRPKLSAGLWVGNSLNGMQGPVEPKQFVAMYRNAKLPARGQLIETEMVK